MSDPRHANSEREAPSGPPLSADDWSLLLHRLSKQAERSLWWMRKGTASGDDAVMSALRTYLRQADAGELPPPHDPDSLWPVLERQLRRKIDKAAASQRYLKNKRAVRYSELAPLLDGRPADTAFVDRAGGPEEVEAYVAQALQLLEDSINDKQLLQIARLKLECYDMTEIAAKLSLTEHQVRRRLSRIRTLLDGAEEQPG